MTARSLTDEGGYLRPPLRDGMTAKGYTENEFKEAMKRLLGVVASELFATY